MKHLWPKTNTPVVATLALDAVLLDAGGVLILPHVGRLADAVSPLGITPPDRGTVERAHYLAVQALDIAPDDQLAPGTYLEAFVDALDLPVERKAEVCAAVQEVWARPSLYSWRARVRGTGAGLRCLAATGLKLGVVSNSDGTVERQLRRARICQVGIGRGTAVLLIVDSAVFGVAKPDPSIFQHAVAALGVAPESFYATLAVYPPYNRHLVHDFGAFMLGLGTTFGFALAGNAVGALAHFVSHTVDRDLGGQPGDPLVVGAFALVLVGLVVWRARTIGLTRR